MSATLKRWFSFATGNMMKAQVTGLPCTHRLKRSALVKKKRDRVRDKLVLRK